MSKLFKGIQKIANTASFFSSITDDVLENIVNFSYMPYIMVMNNVISKFDQQEAEDEIIDEKYSNEVLNKMLELMDFVDLLSQKCNLKQPQNRKLAVPEISISKNTITFDYLDGNLHESDISGDYPGDPKVHNFAVIINRYSTKLNQFIDLINKYKKNV